MVVAAALVPHQLSVAVTVVPPFLRLLPAPVAELPARRLKLMVSGPAAGKVAARSRCRNSAAVAGRGIAGDGHLLRFIFSGVRGSRYED